jgi:hypothetical protein
LDGKGTGGVHVENINVVRGVAAVIGYRDCIGKVMPGVNRVRIIGLGNRKVRFIGRYPHSTEVNVKRIASGNAVLYT